MIVDSEITSSINIDKTKLQKSVYLLENCDSSAELDEIVPNTTKNKEKNNDLFNVDYFEYSDDASFEGKIIENLDNKANDFINKENERKQKKRTTLPRSDSLDNKSNNTINSVDNSSNYILKKNSNSSYVYLHTTASQDLNKILMLYDENDEFEAEDNKEKNLKKSDKIATMKNLSIDDFELIYELGAGGYGKVHLCKKKQTSDTYAIKIVDIAFMVNIIYEYFIEIKKTF